MPDQSHHYARIVCLIGVLAAAMLQPHDAWGQNALPEPPPVHLRDQSRELQMKIKAPFTLVAVGDMLQMIPFSNNNDPRIQALMKIEAYQASLRGG